jgi:hypothetical protein
MNFKNHFSLRSDLLLKTTEDTQRAFNTLRRSPFLRVIARAPFARPSGAVLPFTDLPVKSPEDQNNL